MDELSKFWKKGKVCNSFIVTKDNLLPKVYIRRHLEILRYNSPSQWVSAVVCFLWKRFAFCTAVSDSFPLLSVQSMPGPLHRKTKLHRRPSEWSHQVSCTLHVEFVVREIWFYVI